MTRKAKPALGRTTPSRARAHKKATELVVEALLDGRPLPPAARGGANSLPQVEDALNPKTIIVREIEARQKLAIEKAMVDLQQEAGVGFLELAFGGPQVERDPEVWLVFAGQVGTRVPIDQPWSTRDQQWETRGGPNPFIVLRAIHKVSGISSAQRWDVTRALTEPRSSMPEPNPYSWSAIEAELSPGEPGWGFPGLAWDLPAPVSARLERVRVVASGRELSWRLDASGRLFIPSQSLGSEDSGGELRLRLDLRVEAGELPYLGRMMPNGAWLALRGDGCEPRAGAFDHEGVLRVEQPFDACPGRPHESREEWGRRVRAECRHRRRAVTAADFRDLVAAEFPEVALREVRPTRVRIASRLERAVRVVVLTRGGVDLSTLLDTSLASSRRIQSFLQDKVLDGIHVLVGPPSFRVQEAPQPGQRLWLYREYLATGGPAQAVHARADGTFWPTVSLAEISR